MPMKMKNWSIRLVLTLVMLLPTSIALAAGDAGGHGEHHVNWVYVGSLFFNFTAFVLLLFFLLRKPVAGFFSTRAKEVSDQLAAAERAREASEQKIKEYGDKIAELMSTRAEVLEKAKKEAEYEKERIISQAQVRAGRIIKDAETTINSELEIAKNLLTSEAIKEIVVKAEDLLVKAVSDNDQARLADDYIEMLREVKGS